jgi:hypothetical protein
MQPEGWILAGTLDGVTTFPSLATPVCGMEHGLRLAHDLAAAGAAKVFVIWNEDGELPVLAERAGRATIEVVRVAPLGDPRDVVIVTRADRVVHPDMPRWARTARNVSGAAIGRVMGHDAVFSATRGIARGVVERARAPRGIANALASLMDFTAFAPTDGFSARPSGPSSLRDAERQLAWSLEHAMELRAS